MTAELCREKKNGPAPEGAGLFCIEGGLEIKQRANGPTKIGQRTWPLACVLGIAGCVVHFHPVKQENREQQNLLVPGFFIEKGYTSERVKVNSVKPSWLVTVMSSL